MSLGSTTACDLRPTTSTRLGSGRLSVESSAELRPDDFFRWSRMCRKREETAPCSPTPIAFRIASSESCKDLESGMSDVTSCQCSLEVT